MGRKGGGDKFFKFLILFSIFFSKGAIAAERRRKMGMRRKKVEEEVKTMFVSCNL